MNSKIFEIDEQAAGDGDYHVHVRSLLEIAKSIKEPTSALKEIMNEAEASLEGHFANCNTFSDLRDTLFAEPKEPKLKYGDIFEYDRDGDYNETTHAYYDVKHEGKDYKYALITDGVIEFFVRDEDTKPTVKRVL
jgi:hypothetical protein